MYQLLPLWQRIYTDCWIEWCHREHNFKIRGYILMLHDRYVLYFKGNWRVPHLFERSHAAKSPAFFSKRFRGVVGIWKRMKIYFLTAEHTIKIRCWLSQDKAFVPDRNSVDTGEFRWMNLLAGATTTFPRNSAEIIIYLYTCAQLFICQRSFHNKKVLYTCFLFFSEVATSQQPFRLPLTEVCFLRVGGFKYARIFPHLIASSASLAVNPWLINPDRRGKLTDLLNTTLALCKVYGKKTCGWSDKKRPSQDY